MSLPQPSVEFSLAQPRSDRPELLLIEGGGETGSPEQESARPDLYVVPDVESAIPRQRAAKQTSHLLGVVRSGKVLRSAASETAGISGGDDHHRRGGGGGWAIREYIRQLAAKAKAEAEDHENSCVCQVCRNL